MRSDWLTTLFDGDNGIAGHGPPSIVSSQTAQDFAPLGTGDFTPQNERGLRQLGAVSWFLSRARHIE